MSSGKQVEVSDVLNTAWHLREGLGLNAWQLKTLDAIRRCRTASLGGHIDACDSCGNVTISYNSCRNRHCPKCQGEKRQEWIEQRERELLPVPYFHVVFTLPQELNQLAMYKPKLVYDALFEASWFTLKTFGKDPKHLGAMVGAIAILHTWGQNLSLHPHLHCIVPGGGVTSKGCWRFAKSKGNFLFPVKAMSLVFRAKCIKILEETIGLAPSLLSCLYKKAWVVFAKRPFGSASSVVEYLGRYTHKVAISNHRLLSIDKQHVAFKYKDYKTGGAVKIMHLTHPEFIRRFALHILPHRFVRIRHYGLLSSSYKRQKLPQLILKLTGIEPPPKPVKTPKTKTCQCCGIGLLIPFVVFDGRGPPKEFTFLLDNSASTLP
jgi:hypothetical protein